MVSDMEDKYIKLSDAKNALADYIAEQTVSKYGSLEACREARFGAEGAMKELDYVPTADVVPKSEVERLEKEVADLQDALKCEKETNNHLSDEYISAQKEIARLKKASLPSYCQAVSEEKAIKIGKEYGRAEVANEIFAEIENFLLRIVGEFDKALDKAIREDKYGLASLCSDEKNLVITLKIAIAELKKKYTEVNDDQTDNNP